MSFSPHYLAHCSCTSALVMRKEIPHRSFPLSSGKYRNFLYLYEIVYCGILRLLRELNPQFLNFRTGIILMIFGEIGNFSAYGFAPASLVAPLGTTTVIGMYSFKMT